VDEIRARQEREQAERDAQIAREEKRRIDRTLREKYASEEVIVGLRDQRIVELEKQIEFNEIPVDEVACGASPGIRACDRVRRDRKSTTLPS
jgi:hypothetical protein